MYNVKTLLIHWTEETAVISKILAGRATGIRTVNLPSDRLEHYTTRNCLVGSLFLLAQKNSVTIELNLGCRICCMDHEEKGQFRHTNGRDGNLVLHIIVNLLSYVVYAMVISYAYWHERKVCLSICKCIASSFVVVEETNLKHLFVRKTILDFQLRKFENLPLTSFSYLENSKTYVSRVRHINDLRLSAQFTSGVFFAQNR
jgi:hypothetical protein